MNTHPLLRLATYGFAMLLPRRLHTLETLKSEYDAVLKLARDRGVTLSRDPRVEELKPDNVEDLEFIEALIDHIRESILMVPPPRGRR
jgi:NifB/MoaA-like Fe-S oxidoreductase